MKTLLIVGGGASGVLAAVHCLKHEVAAKVVLFEKGTDLGAGIAYGTEHPGHLLNVAAEGMSAFQDESDHFVEWLKHNPKFSPEGGWRRSAFVPRRLYRDYLADLVKPFLVGLGNFSVVHEEVAGLQENIDGVELWTQGGHLFNGDAAILASGNESPDLSPEHWRIDCWTSNSSLNVPPESSVAILGTGLSMVDSVVTLLDAGHIGPITAMSRRGLLPMGHLSSNRYQFGQPEIPFGQALRRLIQWFRQKVREGQSREGRDWRDFVDGLRPFSQELWLRLPYAEKRRFLRHFRPWWDTHRHRMAPQIRTRMDDAMTSGQLTVMRGRVGKIFYKDGLVNINFTARGCKNYETLQSQFLIEARGQNANVNATRNPVLRQLLKNGSARPDEVGLGIAVSEDNAVIDRSGHASRRIFAIGPVTSGTLWEIIAIPDIRVQAQSLAAHLRDSSL